MTDPCNKTLNKELHSTEFRVILSDKNLECKYDADLSQVRILFQLMKQGARRCWCINRE